MSDLIIVKQLPIIEEKLKGLAEEIDKEVESARALVCTEDTVKTVKEVRADLNKKFKELETQRKAVKEQIMVPYNNFETIYKECVSDKFKNADTELKNKIDNVESELKAKKEQDVKEYFEEYKTANDIDFINYEQANINVTLTASMKSLKEQVKTFIDKVVDDLNLIDTQEHKAEILVEYKKTLNVSSAITIVVNRVRAVEEEKKKQEETRQKLHELLEEECNKVVGITERDIELGKDFIDRAIERDNLIQFEQPKDIQTFKFTVRANKNKLTKLVEFLTEGGYDYE